mmetsp:Transcript_35774/g.40601  ORF Transcript_35774/g.40601 Transcript_35774/m.40601 type:complete len:86 (+) Transcript_35774:137-394(+)
MTKTESMHLWYVFTVAVAATPNNEFHTAYSRSETMDSHADDCLNSYEYVKWDVLLPSILIVLSSCSSDILLSGLDQVLVDVVTNE